MHKIFRPLFIIVMLYCGGCSGGTEGTGSTVLGSVPPFRSINSLNADERSTLCSNMQAKLRASRSQELYCNYNSSYLADEFYMNHPEIKLPLSYADPFTGSRDEWVNLCRQADADCNAAPYDSEQFCADDPNYGACPLDEPEFFEHCDAPVSLLAACIDEVINLIVDNDASFNCENGYEERFHHIAHNEGRVFAQPSCERLFFTECRNLPVEFSGFNIGQCSITFPAQQGSLQ